MSARQFVAGLPDRGVDPCGERLHEVFQPGGTQGLFGSPTVDFLLLFAQGDVFQQGAVQQEHVLRNVADGILPAAAVGGGQGLAVDHDFTAGGGIESQQKVEQGRFSGPRCASDTDVFSLADRECQPVQHLFVAALVVEAEREVAHGDFTFEGQRRLCG